jgi:signal transduction histidine kinase
VAPDGPSTSDQQAWSDSSARAVLQLMVESVAEMIGFEYAVLSVVDGDELLTIAYYGPDEHREYLSQSDPVSILDPILERAEEWGPRLRYLPAGATQGLEGHWVRFEQAESDEPDAWNPSDALLAVLRDDEGAVVGILSVDKPLDGRKPDERQRSLFERYAAQAERAVLTTIERDGLVQQVAHAEAARRLVRSASMPAHPSLAAVLRHTRRPLVEGFGAGGSWIQVLGQSGVAYARTGGGERLELSPALVDLAHDLAPSLWAEQRALVLTVGESPELPDQVHQELAALEVTHALAVALGAGSECVGFLALSRFAEDPPWSAVECAAAVEIGHDLGAALMTARALESERKLVHELQQLDDYRSQLIATLSHELRTPLTVIAGNLEMLGTLDLSATAERYHAAMTRGTTRMARVVDDLLLLARVSNPQHPLERVPVDLRAVVRDVVALVESAARGQGLTLGVDLGEDIVVLGDPTELDRLLGNLVSNAVKYTPPGGRISVEARRRGNTVELLVQDDGLGISEEDQRGLFQAFFRTSNPDALREPGTGLGLAIVASVAERHGGRVDVRSRLGEGTAFTVTLPAATPEDDQKAVEPGFTTPSSAATSTSVQIP